MTDEEIVAALAEVLRQHRWAAEETPPGTRDEDFRPGAPCMDCGEYPGPRHERSDCVRAVAHAMTRTVRRIAEQRAAEEIASLAAVLDARAQKAWETYKFASPADPGRANPYYEGVADAYGAAESRLTDRAATLTATANHGRNAT